MSDFNGRVAIVTGAARGLGRAVAERLHERGASVAVNVRDRERAEALASSIGERAIAVPGDISAPGVPEEIVRVALERFGRIDIVVNNAAFARSTRFPNLSVDEFRQALEVNLVAPFLLTQAVLPTMKAQNYGRIINISSSAGRMVSTLGGAHYTASKAGLLGLTRAAAKELGQFGITVNAVCPGMIDTELTHENASPELLTRLAASYPIPRLGTSLEVAGLICFAASEEAGYITGASFDINGGDLMMWGGRRSAPYAFTEHGVAMLSSVLRSNRAIAVNIEIVRAFVHLRQIISEHAELAKRLDELEENYDAKFQVVFDAIRGLIQPRVKEKKRIGYLLSTPGAVSVEQTHHQTHQTDSHSSVGSTSSCPGI